MKKYMLALGLSLLTVLGLFAGCSPKAETASGSDSLKIVATIFPEYDWVRQVLGDRAGEVELTLLLDSGTDLHSYQPTAADMLTIGECDLFLYNGGESDAWVERVLATAANPGRRTLSVMEVLGDSVLEEEVVEGMQEAEDHDHAEGEAHEEEADEHVWLSLRNARTACAEIARVLGELDPDHAAEYQANAENYMAELEALDGEYTALAENAARRTVLVGDRFPFRYLMDDYGLEYYAAFSGCSAETEASFETIAFLSGKTEELALPCILTTESPQPGVAETIRSNTASGDQTILRLDSMQSAGTGDNYLDIMKENLEVLRQALA